MRKNIAPFFRVAAAILMFSVLASCSNEYRIEPFDYKAEYDRVSKTKPAETERKPLDITDLTKSRMSYRYSPVGKRDPFRSYFGDPASMVQERKIVSELQNFDVSDLRLTAIIWGITEPRVIMVSPDGKSHIVRTGSFVGKNWGKISRILPDKIEIIETYKDPLGRKIINKLYIELPVKTALSQSDEPMEDSGAVWGESEGAGTGSAPGNVKSTIE
jgi:type IV pilus assembly protein PilP